MASEHKFRDVSKTILGPRKTAFLHGPQLLPAVIPGSPGGHVNGHEVIHVRMSLLSIGTSADLGHLVLPLGDVGDLNGLFERVVEADCVRHGTRIIAHVVEVVDRHARADDDDAFVAEGGEGGAEAVVSVRVF